MKKKRVKNYYYVLDLEIDYMVHLHKMPFIRTFFIEFDKKTTHPISCNYFVVFINLRN